MKRFIKIVTWIFISATGAVSLGAIAFERREPLNAVWFVVAALATFAVAYRFYSSFIAAKVLALDDPAPRPLSGTERRAAISYPTNRWVLLGHHFAAIAGPGPLVGPTLAAQFGVLPGTLWIIIGVVLGGASRTSSSWPLDAARRSLAGPDGAR